VIECPRCFSANEDDGAFCDQCGAKLDPNRKLKRPPEPEPASLEAEPFESVEGGCPDCGGKVRPLSATKGICLSCGRELVAVDD
jgi:predicted amidophosphoribosyltransferase